MIAQCGTIAAGMTIVGEMIANAMDKLAKGVISLEEGKSMTTELEVTEGMRFDKGDISVFALIPENGSSSRWPTSY